MTQRLDLDSDPFLKVLTDALRSGPGSPEWHEAVAALRSEGHPDADEYRLLISAREHLESGKEFRAVRAGPGFTRKLLAGLDDAAPAGGRRGLPLATLIAIISGVAILALLALVVYQLIPRGDMGHGAVDDLAATYFSNEALSAKFANGIPPGWRPIGRLELDSSNGLRPAALQTVPAGAYTGGGLAANEPLPPDQAFSIEVDVKDLKPADNVIAEIFVSGEPDFSEDRATSSHELVWLLRGVEQRVVLDGRVQAESQTPKALRSQMPVRIIMNRDLAVVEVGRQRVWAGTHHLAADKPRYVGVRFLRTDGSSAGGPVVTAARVMKN